MANKTKIIKDDSQAVKNMTYEEAVARLEVIVKTLEQGDGEVPLDECMKLYEEGVALVRRCHTELKEAEQKVQILQRGEDGEIMTAPFSSTEDDAH